MFTGNACVKIARSHDCVINRLIFSISSEGLYSMLLYERTTYQDTIFKKVYTCSEIVRKHSCHYNLHNKTHKYTVGNLSLSIKFHQMFFGITCKKCH